MSILEKDVQKAIISYLNFKKVEHSVTDASRTFSRSGGVRKSKVDSSWPDISAVIPVTVNGFKVGLAFFVEVKRPSGGHTSNGQKEKLTSLANSGALCIVARSLQDVMQVLEDVQGKELNKDVVDHYNTLLQLNLGDRRKTRLTINEITRTSASKTT